MQISLHNQLYLPDYDQEKSKWPAPAHSASPLQRLHHHVPGCEHAARPHPRQTQVHVRSRKQTQTHKLKQRLANKETRLLEICLGDVRDFFSSGRDSGFIDRVTTNTQRYSSLFADIVEQNMPQPSVNFREEDKTPFDHLMEQRKHNHQAAMERLVQQGLQKPGQTASSNQAIPKELERQWQIVIVPSENDKKAITKMREIKAQRIGNLVSIRGIITRVSDVRPLMKVATYFCSACGYEVYQVIHHKSFMPLLECPSDRCKQNNIKGELMIQIKSSYFESF